MAWAYGILRGSGDRARAVPPSPEGPEEVVAGLDLAEQAEL